MNAEEEEMMTAVVTVETARDRVMESTLWRPLKEAVSTEICWKAEQIGSDSNSPNQTVPSFPVPYYTES